MTPDGSTRELAAQREEAAADLQDAIEGLGVALRCYDQLTQTLSARLSADLPRRLEIPIVLHLARAGLGGFLERKLVGTPANLRDLVVEDHERAGVSR